MLSDACVTPCPEGYQVSGADCIKSKPETPCDGAGGICTSDKIGDGTCHVDCNIVACTNDGGDCVIPEPECTSTQYKEGGVCKNCENNCNTCTSSLTCTSCAAIGGETLYFYNNK
jgi:hypothetical protein